MQAVADADGAGDASASFTLTAPATRRTEAVPDDNKTDNQVEAGEEESQMAVSASYTIVSRRDKPVEQQQEQAKESEAEQQQQIKTDSDEANQRTRPNELSLAPASESKAQAATTPATPATTPGTVESPVRLRDKRSLSSSTGGGGAGGDYDGKSETASPVSVHGDFNARDSLLSLYARGAGGAGAGAAHATAGAAAPSSSSSTSAVERRPSWRLMLDAGSKVMHIHSRTQNYLQQQQKQFSSATQLTANRTEPKRPETETYFFSRLASIRAREFLFSVACCFSSISTVFKCVEYPCKSSLKMYINFFMFYILMNFARVTSLTNLFLLLFIVPKLVSFKYFLL